MYLYNIPTHTFVWHLTPFTLKMTNSAVLVDLVDEHDNNIYLLCIFCTQQAGSKICFSYSTEGCLLITIMIAVDGNYSEWSEFQACSVTCGKGIQSRSRSCINPPPQHGGKNCSAFGPLVETKECNLRECPSMNIIFVFILLRYLSQCLEIVVACSVHWTEQKEDSFFWV